MPDNLIFIALYFTLSKRRPLLIYKWDPANQFLASLRKLMSRDVRFSTPVDIAVADLAPGLTRGGSFVEGVLIARRRQYQRLSWSPTPSIARVSSMRQETWKEWRSPGLRKSRMTVWTGKKCLWPRIQTRYVFHCMGTHSLVPWLT